MDIGRGGALHRMRWLRLLLIFLAGHTAAMAIAEEIDEVATPIELNPHDYLPLAVGNRWTYEHYYFNESYPGGSGWYDLEYLKAMEIPGYPHGRENPIPPDSLTFVERILTIEITHTEMIDGFEYFVFSGPDYAWPPLPDLFWGGKKVRISDEDFLVFRWNGQDLPLYDFSHHHFDRYDDAYYDSYRYPVILPRIEEVSDLYRKVDIRGTDKSGIYFSRYILPSYPELLFFWDHGETQLEFLHGYGMALFNIVVLREEWVPIFHILLTPISASIDGKEIPFPEHLSLPYLNSSVQPTSWGQLKNSVLRTK